jgi:hypothetical protein
MDGKFGIRAIIEKIYLIGILDWCFVGMVTLITCLFKMNKKFGGNWSINQHRNSIQHGSLVTIAPQE